MTETRTRNRHNGYPTQRFLLMTLAAMAVMGVSQVTVSAFVSGSKATVDEMQALAESIDRVNVQNDYTSCRDRRDIKTKLKLYVDTVVANPRPLRGLTREERQSALAVRAIFLSSQQELEDDLREPECLELIRRYCDTRVPAGQQQACVDRIRNGRMGGGG